MQSAFRISALLVISTMAAAAGEGGPSGPQSIKEVVNSGATLSVRSLNRPLYTPRALQAETVDVVVQVGGQSVSELEASMGRRLTRLERGQVRTSLRAAQDTLRSAIESAGGQVMNQFQSAINGIKVRIAPDRVWQLRTLPNVVNVLPVQRFTIDNTTSVPYIGAPLVWNPSPAPNLHGEGIKIGVIDTGIDYTHANFGGPGTPAAYTAALAADADPADPALFGPNAPKVKGGFDFVGDDYDAGGTAAQQVPHPDPNPLDCNGHGSHVSGTAAGFGVTSAGTTFAGPYGTSIYTPGAFTIGPGVAPKADLYAYRVFGCSGTTSVVIDAIDRAVSDGMDVINLSLGSPFGTGETADAVAASNAARAGVIVVSSAGNSGANPYVTSTPASGDGVISVAANDAHASFPGALTTISTGGTITMQDSNEAIFSNGLSLSVAVLRTSYPSGPVSLGCSAADYSGYPGGVTGKLVVTQRGTCARVLRAQLGQAAGAAAVAMIDTNPPDPPATYPPMEGPIPGVIIPFFGVRGADGGLIVAADSPQGTSGTVTLQNSNIPNPEFSMVADFSSGGPRNGDSVLKPDLTAPGVDVFSTLLGTGNGGAFLSGTSMAAPHVTGVAALARQAHPTWGVAELKAAIVGTSDPGAIAGFLPRLGGAGLVQALGAVQTKAFAVGDNNGNVAVNFGFHELNRTLNLSGHIRIRNRASSPVTFSVSVTNQSGVPHVLTPNASSIRIEGNEDEDLGLRLSVPASTVGDSSAFHDLSGIVNLTPVGGGNNGVGLHVPYYLVPRALSDENARAAGGGIVRTSAPSTTVTVSNGRNAAIAGNADFYAWGIHDNNSGGDSSNLIRDVGVQAFQNAGGSGNPLIVFGLNTYNRWSNAATNEFDIFVDVDPQNNNGDDYDVVGVDFGAVTSGTFNGQLGTFVISLRSGRVSFLNPVLTFAPTDSSSASLPVLASQLCRTNEPCLSASNPRFTYHIRSFDLTGTSIDTVPSLARFNAFAPSMSTGAFLPSIAPGSSASTTITIDPAEWALTPALGALILTTDNQAGMEEAQEVRLRLQK